MSSEHLIYKENNGILAQLDDSGIKVSEQSYAVLQEEIKEQRVTSYFNCFGSHPYGDLNGCFIPYRSILWCEQSADKAAEVEVTFALKDSGTLNICKRNFEIQDSPGDSSSWADEIIKRSYSNSAPQPSVLVIVNPHGGKGNALRLLETKIKPVLQAARAKVTYIETKYRNHAQEVARSLKVEEYDIVACCSGDGIPHEVINGFYQKEHKGIDAFRRIALAQLPCGSGNALSLSTFGTNEPSIATLSMLKAKRRKMDLMAITQEIDNEEITKLSFLSQCYGVIADCDIGTEALRWLGPFRFELGIAHKVLTKKEYPCDLYVKYAIESKEEMPVHISENLKNRPFVDISPSTFSLKAPSLQANISEEWVHISDRYTSKLNIFYVGKMPYVSDGAQFFPAALPDDGMMDMILTNTDVSVAEMTTALLSVDHGGHILKSKVQYSKILGYRLVPKGNEKHYISVDGEEFPFGPFQTEVVPQALTFLSENGNFVDTSMVKS